MPAPRVTLWFHLPICWLFMLIAFSLWASRPTHTEAATHTAYIARRRHDLNVVAAGIGGLNPQHTGVSADLRSTEQFTATLAVNTRAAAVGSTLVYTLTLMNNSDAPELFEVTDTLPDNLTLVDARGMTASGQVLTASGTLDGGAQQQFIITARIHVYRFMVENAATVRFGGQTQSVAAPVVRIASAAPAFVHYLPLITR